MRVAVAVLACLIGIALAKPDEQYKRKLEEHNAIRFVKRLYMEENKLVSPHHTKYNRIALHGGRKGQKDLGSGESQTIAISSQQYVTNFEEMWTIRGSSSSDVVQLAFESMSLEAADSSWGHCWDSVQVFDGPDKDSPRLGSYCGTTLPPTLSSSTNVMTVLFDSDCSITADGFSATASVQSLADLPRTMDAQAGCNGGLALMGGDTGYIESPNYNGNYESYENCKWMFAAESGTITFEIEDFNVEKPNCPYSYGCPYDKLMITDLNDGIMGELCGWDMNSNSFGGRSTWTTTSSQAELLFTSDCSVEGRGFRIKYTYNAGGGVSVDVTDPEHITPAPPAPTPSAAPEQTPGTLWNEFDAIRGFSLFAHNYVRDQHRNTGSLSWSSSLEQSSQEWAMQLALEDAFYHSTGSYGENLYWSMGYPREGSIARAVFDWYEERHNYDYTSGSSSNGGVIGHFTACLWDDTTEVGCGVATKGSETYVVCQYSPPGNYIGQYASHVHPLKDNAQPPQDSSWLDDMK